MPACATQKKVDENVRGSNLILPVPDTDFRDFLDEVAELARVAPEIIGAIEKDLDRYARQKKSLRLTGTARSTGMFAATVPRLSH